LDAELLNKSFVIQCTSTNWYGIFIPFWWWYYSYGEEKIADCLETE
jgi:hypothetical protein